MERIELDAAPLRFGREHLHDIRDNFRDNVHCAKFDGLLSHQVAYAADDLACAKVIPTNVGKNLSHMLEMWVFGLEKHLGSICVAEYRAERLIYLMRNRCGQFTDGSEACRMSELFAFPASLEFGGAAASQLSQQRVDQHRLEQDQRRRDHGDSGRI